MQSISCAGCFTPREELWYPLNKRVGTPQSWSGHIGEKKPTAPVGNQTHDCAAHNLVTILCYVQDSKGRSSNYITTTPPLHAFVVWTGTTYFYGPISYIVNKVINNEDMIGDFRTCFWQILSSIRTQHLLHSMYFIINCLSDKSSGTIKFQIQHIKIYMTTKLNLFSISVTSLLTLSIHSFIHSIQFHQSVTRSKRPVRYRISHNTVYLTLIHKI
jgi:hypothetical protein